MFPINKEWITPESLLEEAAILERTARRPEFGVSLVADLLGGARNRRKRAQAMQDAQDLREASDYLAEKRVPRGIATPANPYGDLQAA